MSDQRSRYDYEASPEQQAFIERTIHDSQEARRPRSVLPAALIALSVLVTFGAGMAFKTDALKDGVVLMALALGPATCVLAAKTPSGRVIASVIVAVVGLGWWQLLGLFGQTVAGLGETGAAVIFGPCLLAPLIVATAGLTVVGITKLYLAAD